MQQLDCSALLDIVGYRSLLKMDLSIKIADIDFLGKFAYIRKKAFFTNS